MNCEVCGAVLLGRTRTCGQPCAGKLAAQTSASFKYRDHLRAKYGNIEKQGAREVMEPDIRALRPGARVLDLYGGGLSAEWILSLRPDVDLWVAERDRKLWPALKADAKRIGFTPVLGDLTTAAGRFDLIFLDLCCEPYGAAEAVEKVVGSYPSSGMLTGLLFSRMAISMGVGATADSVPCVLYVTVLGQNRHGYSELKGKYAHHATYADLELAASGHGVLLVEEVHSYRQAGGFAKAYLWRVGASYASVAALIERKRQEDAEEREKRRRWHFESTVFSHVFGYCACITGGWVTRAEHNMAEAAKGAP